MYSCYTQYVVKTILTMVLYVFSKYCLTALISMQYKILMQGIFSLILRTCQNTSPHVRIQYSPIVRAHFLGTETAGSIELSISWPRLHQRQARRADKGRGWNKWLSFWTLFSQRMLCSWQSLLGNCKPWEWCIVSAMACSLAVSAGRGACQREVLLMKHRWVEKEGESEEGGRGKVWHKKLAFKYWMLSFFHQFLATWLLQSTYLLS